MAGHGVAQAAMAEGWATLRANEIPADWPETRVMAFLAADNELSRLSDPDQAALAALIDEARQFDGELLAAIGYDDREFAELLKEVGKTTTTTNGDAPPQVDRADELRKLWQVEPGQLWRIGEHRLAVGDCTNPSIMDALLQGEKPRYGIQDPPYGISVVAGSKSFGSVAGSKSFGSVGGSNIVRANKYVPIVDDDKPYDPTYILGICPDTVLWGANYYSDKLPPKKGWLVWDKKGKDWDDNFSDCELAWTPFNVVTKIYRYLWMGIVQEGPRETRVHPTQKPVGLYVNIINELFTEPGLIVDFYGGSGTTMLACENARRVCRMAEISPAYCGVILQRMRDAFPGIEIERLNG